MLKRLLSIAALATTFIGMPVLGVLEYYSKIKMGMYRYVFMKNARLAANIFTPEAVSLIQVISPVLILLILIMLVRYEFRRKVKVCRYWQLYGAVMAAAGWLIFQETNFTPYTSKGWLTAPWFGIALLLSEALWLVASILFICKKPEDV